MSCTQLAHFLMDAPEDSVMGVVPPLRLRTSVRPKDARRAIRFSMVRIEGAALILISVNCLVVLWLMAPNTITRVMGYHVGIVCVQLLRSCLLLICAEKGTKAYGYMIDVLACAFGMCGVSLVLTMFAPGSVVHTFPVGTVVLFACHAGWLITASLMWLCYAGVMIGECRGKMTTRPPMDDEDFAHEIVYRYCQAARRSIHRGVRDVLLSGSGGGGGGGDGRGDALVRVTTDPAQDGEEAIECIVCRHRTFNEAPLRMVCCNRENCSVHMCLQCLDLVRATAQRTRPPQGLKCPACAQAW